MWKAYHVLFCVLASLYYFYELRVVDDGCAFFFFFKQKTAYEMRISDWSSDVCSSDLPARAPIRHRCEGRLMHKRLRSIPRWASLTMMAFWLVQALTGLLLVFSWALDDATLSAPHVPTDMTPIAAALARLPATHPGTRLAAVRTRRDAPLVRTRGGRPHE